MLEKKIRALVPTGFGLNCNYETAYALGLAGAEVSQVHLNELFESPSDIHDYQIIAFIGGFAHGDELGAGQVLANRVNDYMIQDILKYIKEGKLMVGICNGFQVLVKAGLLPGFDGRNERLMSVTYNDSGNFLNKWVDLKINQDSPCVWTRGIEYTKATVRHGEGKIVTLNDTVRQKLWDQDQVVMQYRMGGTKELADGHFTDNPNGSRDDIAGICDPTGRIFGLMPHPEAFNDQTNDPDYTRIRESYLSRGLPMPEAEGQGIQIFRNAVQYVKENLL